MRKRIYILALALALVSGIRAEVLTLDSCLQMARRNNPEIRKAQLDVERAEQVKAQALTKYFPQVQGMAFGYHALHPIVDVGIDDIHNASVRDLLTTLYGNYGAALGLESTINLFQHGYLVGVTALQPVFVGGKIVAGNRLAKVGVEAARLQSEIAQREQLEQVEQTYWLLYGLEEKQSIIDDATLLLDTIYSAVSSAVEAGLALPSDLTQVELKRDDIHRKQLQLQSGLVLARRALALSVGISDAQTIVLAPQTIEVEAVLPVDTTAVTAEQQLLTLQVRAAELEKRMALADALPQLAVGANYGYGHWQTNLLRDGIGGKNGNGALFVTLNVPITGWWETGHKLKEKQYILEQAKIDRDYLGAQLDLRTRQAYDQMVDAAALWQLQERALTHAQQAFEQTHVNYDAGLATIAELLQAQTALTQAKADLTDARIAYRIQTQRYKDLTQH